MATDAQTELHEAIAQLTSGKRDPVAMRKAAERMDRGREELRGKIGTVDVAVDLIRDARNQ